MSQYDDNTTIILDGSEKSLQTLMYILKSIHVYTSGHKTPRCMSKQYKYSNRKLCQDIKLIWTTNLNFSVLSMMKIIRMNYDKKKTKNKLKPINCGAVEKEKFILGFKVTLTKSLIISHLNHLHCNYLNPRNQLFEESEQYNV